MNMIQPSYGKRKHRRAGRRWHEAVVRLTGLVVSSVEAVFAVDWYTESGEVLPPEWYLDPDPAPPDPTEEPHALQVVPSGPGFRTQPNLRLFTSMIHRARRELHLVSPYFVPDEAVLEAITTAAHRGVQVALYVSERADQFMVQYAQASYYHALLEAGVRIYRYPAPNILHAKLMTVDDELAVIGSSNLDLRSFNLNFEITLLAVAGDLPLRLRLVAQEYRRISHELTADEWRGRPLPTRYLENTLRLTSALQ